jgi:hypothetical protein
MGDRHLGDREAVLQRLRRQFSSPPEADRGEDDNLHEAARQTR